MELVNGVTLLIDWQQERGIETLMRDFRVCHEQESGILDVSVTASVTTRNRVLDRQLIRKQWNGFHCEVSEQ